MGMWNRRFGALILDYIIFLYVPAIIAGIIVAAAGVGEGGFLLVYLAQIVGILLIFGRDALFGGAGPGKRGAGLRVVQSKDGQTPLTLGQGIMRWLSQLIPIFNLFDAMAAYQDPLQRRYGDKWASTRVLDTERKLARDRDKVARRLLKKKGILPPPEFPMTMEGLARVV